MNADVLAISTIGMRATSFARMGVTDGLTVTRTKFSTPWRKCIFFFFSGRINQRPVWSFDY